MTTPLGYCIQFRPYAGKDSILQEYVNIGLGLSASVVTNVVSKLPVMHTSNYHIVMDNYFTIPAFLSHLRAMVVAAIGTVRANRMENAPLLDMVKINKGKCGSSDVVTDVYSNITAVVGKIIKSWMRSRPLLVNNQFNRSNVIVIVKNREWILSNQTS